MGFIGYVRKFIITPCNMVLLACIITGSSTLQASARRFPLPELPESWTAEQQAAATAQVVSWMDRRPGGVPRALEDLCGFTSGAERFVYYGGRETTRWAMPGIPPIQSEDLRLLGGVLRRILRTTMPRKMGTLHLTDGKSSRRAICDYPWDEYGCLPKIHAGAKNIVGPIAVLTLALGDIHGIAEIETTAGSFVTFCERAVPAFREHPLESAPEHPLYHIMMGARRVITTRRKFADTIAYWQGLDRHKAPTPFYFQPERFPDTYTCIPRDKVATYLGLGPRIPVSQPLDVVVGQALRMADAVLDLGQRLREGRGRFTGPVPVLKLAGFTTAPTVVRFPVEVIPRYPALQDAPVEAKEGAASASAHIKSTPDEKPATDPATIHLVMAPESKHAEPDEDGVPEEAALLADKDTGASAAAWAPLIPGAATHADQPKIASGGGADRPIGAKALPTEEEAVPDGLRLRFPHPQKET